MNGIRRSITIAASLQKSSSTSILLPQKAPSTSILPRQKASSIFSKSGHEMENSNSSPSALSITEKADPSSASVTSKDLGSVSALVDWLRHRLGSHQIDQWGKIPGTKRVANLWLELYQGEIVLEDSNTIPRRTVHVACVTITNPTRDLMLVESHQLMGDGSIRVRNRPLSEKMKPGESVEDACFRGIREELGPVLGKPQNVSLMHDTYNKVVEERNSNSYPGLPTCYVLHRIEATVRNLPAHDFVTDEYELCNDINDCVTMSSPNGNLDIASKEDTESNVDAAHKSDDRMNDAGVCHNTINCCCANEIVAVELDDRNISSSQNKVHTSTNATDSSKEKNESAATGVKTHFWKWIPITSS